MPTYRDRNSKVSDNLYCASLEDQCCSGQRKYTAQGCLRHTLVALPPALGEDDYCLSSQHAAPAFYFLQLSGWVIVACHVKDCSVMRQSRLLLRCLLFGRCPTHSSCMHNHSGWPTRQIRADPYSAAMYIASYMMPNLLLCVCQLQSRLFIRLSRACSSC